MCQTDLASCEAAPPGKMLRTGQTTCWNTAGTVVACAGTGQDGELQVGLALAYTDNGDGTITNVNTGLMWEKLDDNNVDGIHDKDRSFTWEDAFATKIAALNAGEFAGYSDWRLPNVRELHSIVNFESLNPAVSSAFNNGCIPGCTVSTCSCEGGYISWSSSSYAYSHAIAWDVYFTDGSTGADFKTRPHFVRAVRGGS